MTNLNDHLRHSPKISSDLILELISYIDLTSLNKNDTEDEINKLIQLANKGYMNTHPAALCVFSKFGSLVASNTNHNIKTAVVCSNFPHGQSLKEVFNYELKLLNNSNIDEVDIINQKNTLHTKSIIDSLHTKKVKTILETGTLTNEEIKLSAISALKAGSDFIKTSTGTSKTGYTPQALYIICLEIKNHFKSTGNRIGIKPSGGIRTLQQAVEIYTIIKNILGIEWLKPTLFRIGASSLYNNLIKEHKKRFIQ